MHQFDIPPEMYQKYVHVHISVKNSAMWGIEPVYWGIREKGVYYQYG